MTRPSIGTSESDSALPPSALPPSALSNHPTSPAADDRPRIQQSDALFRQLFEESADALLLMENDLFIDCNEAAVKMMRCRSKDELLLLHPSQMSPEYQPDGQSSFAKAQAMLDAMKQERSQRFEWVHRRVNGEDFWVDVLLTRIDIEERQILHVTWREISDRKIAEAELREQAQLLRSMYEAVEYSITIVDVLEDREFRFVGWNPATERMTGISGDAIAGQTPEQLMGALHGKIVRQDYCRCLEAGTSITYEEYLPLGGRDFWWLTTLNPLRDEQDRIYRIVVTSFDITDRKAAETALKEANVLLNSVLETIPGLFFVKDRQGRYLASNSNLADFFGRPIPEILGRTDADLLSPEIAAHVMDKDRRVFESGAIQRYEEVVCTHGIDCTYLTTKTPLFDTQGDMMGLIGIALDITDRKTAEQAQARLTAILEATSDLIGIADMQGRSLYLNRAGQQLLEISPAAAVGLPIEAMLTAATKPIVLQQGIPIAIELGIWQGESVYRSRSGREIPVSQVIIAHKAADGTPEYLSTIARDITEQKQAEISLQQRARREKLLNRITSQVRCSLDFDQILTTAVEEIRKFMRVDSCSFAWYCRDAEVPYWEVVQQSSLEGQPNLRGLYPASILGNLTAELLELKPIRIENVSQLEDTAIRQLFDRLGYAGSLSLPMQTFAGLIGVMSCQSRSPRRWTHDEVKLLQAVMEQLTIALNQAELYTQSQTKARELEQTLAELQRTQMQMIQSEKMSSLGQLVAGVAHEINNPVNFIYGNISPAEQYMQDLLNLIHLYETHYPDPAAAIQAEIEAIDLPFVSEDLPRLLASMKMGADRIRQIVSSLRTFSRLDEAEYKPVDIHEGIDSTLVILENRLKARPEHPGIQVVKQYGDLPLVQCFAGQLNQVFMNVLSNALDALEERDQSRSLREMAEAPSRILIQTEQLNADRVTIRIADNGPGIPDTIQSRIFDPFFTTKPIGKGTGMGMSISYQIITENHRGTIECRSTPQSGTEFAIEIPLKQNSDWS